MSLNSLQDIKCKIYTFRGKKVMLDRDLARLYGVTTGNLNLSVKRNIERFPEDFMFRLTKLELSKWKLQFAISNSEKMGMRKLPFVFTEHGVAMLSSILKSSVATQINIGIMRAFVELRQDVSVYPEYELLKEKIRRIELEVKEMRLDQYVDNKSVSEKVTLLSGQVREFYEFMNKFNDAYVVIKRPEDDIKEV